MTRQRALELAESHKYNFGDRGALAVALLEAEAELVRYREALKTAYLLSGRFMTSMAMAGVAPEEYSNDPLAEMYFMAAKLQSQITALGQMDGGK